MSPTVLIVISFLSSLLLLGRSSLALAGCGCDKPPPAPAIVIPQVAFSGLPVTLFHSSLQVGQTWTITFRSRGATRTVTAAVVSRRALTDPSGATQEPQLIVTVPDIPVGPTSLTASSDGSSFTVAKNAFTVIARPLMVSEQDTQYTVQRYEAVVGADGNLYMSVGGLNDVCKAMEFRARSPRFPLRVTQMTIFNAQGFFIDSYGPQSAEHFVVEPGAGAKSDLLHYFRHSFSQYCADHQAGGSKEVDPSDPNWHLDGTPHVDYATLIFVLAGEMRGRPLRGGRRIFLALEVQTRLGDGTGAWEIEREEEVIVDDDNDDD